MAGEIISERRATSNRNGGRHHPGIPGDFRRNPQTDRKVINSAGRSVDDWRAAWGGRIDSLGDNPGYFPTTPEGYKFGATGTGLELLNRWFEHHCRAASWC